MRSFPTVTLSCFLVLTAIGGCGQREAAPPPRLRVDRVTELKLGGDPASLLGRPRFVRTDHQGNVYVADAAAMTIRVFDAAGTWIRTLGGRGRDPGQFFDLTCMHVDREGHLIVVDGLNESITRLTSAGEVLAVHSMDRQEMTWPRNLHDSASGRYLFLYKMPSAAAKSLFHLFDHDFRKLGSFGNWTRLAWRTDALNEQLVQVDAGSLWVRRDGTVLYAPRAYAGEVFLFAEKDGEWRRTATLGGHVAQERPLTTVEVEDYNPRELHLTTKDRHGDRGVIFHNESRGLFELRDGRLVHFTLIAAGGERIFGLELFSSDGQLVGYAPLERTPLKERGATFIPLSVLWKDAEDRFYVRHNVEIPEIRVVRLRFAAPAGS